MAATPPRERECERARPPRPCLASSSPRTPSTSRTFSRSFPSWEARAKSNANSWGMGNGAIVARQAGWSKNMKKGGGRDGKGFIGREQGRRARASSFLHFVDEEGTKTTPPTHRTHTDMKLWNKLERYEAKMKLCKRVCQAVRSAFRLEVRAPKPEVSDRGHPRRG